MTDRDVDKLIVVTSAKKGAKPALDQQLIDDGLALYQEQLSEVCFWGNEFGMLNLRATKATLYRNAMLGGARCNHPGVAAGCDWCSVPLPACLAWLG
jgi:hypothetical protein